MPIPKMFKTLGPSVPGSIRFANADDSPDDVLVFSQNQTEAQLENQILIDKSNAVRVIAAKIEHIKKHLLPTARKDLRRQLKKQLVSLEAQERELLKNEIALAKSGQLKRPRLFADLD